MTSALIATPRRPRLLPTGMLPLVSDERLVEQVRAGSERAFETLFDRHHGSLLAFCRHMLRSHDEAEDAVQHTFLAAYRDLLRSEKPIAPRAWLFTIARNRCVSILRARKEQAVEEVSLVGEHLAAEVDRREELRALLADVARLPDDQRAALLLTELSGVPHEEIGDLLGCPQQRVKALVFQARSSLAADRTARETPCNEIRAQLATRRGAALRRGVLRRHLRVCAGCREYKENVRIQRRQLRSLLPVGPGLGLKAGWLGTGGATVGGATLKAGVLGGGLVANVLVGAAITSGGAAAVAAAIAHDGSPAPVRSVAHAGAAQRATQPVGSAGRPAAADDAILPPLGGGIVSPEPQTVLSGAEAPLPVAAAGALELAAIGPDSARESAAPEAAAPAQSSDQPPQGVAEQEVVTRPDETQAPATPPAASAPAAPDGAGHGSPAGSRDAPGGNGPGSCGQAEHGGGPCAPELPPRARGRHGRDAPPPQNHPAPPFPRGNGGSGHPGPPVAPAAHGNGQPARPAPPGLAGTENGQADPGGHAGPEPALAAPGETPAAGDAAAGPGSSPGGAKAPGGRGHGPSGPGPGKP